MSYESNDSELIKDSDDEEILVNIQAGFSPKKLPDIDGLTLERKLPRINCEERIIFVVDISKEENTAPFQLSEGATYSFLYMVKRVLFLYILNKRTISNKHKFALMTIGETPLWISNFTDSCKDILNELEALEDLDIPKSNKSKCDLTDVFDEIKNHITLPQRPSNIAVSPPPYIVRTILFYGRSFCLPQFLNGKESFLALTRNPYFFIDVLYAHEAPSDENKCEGIFDLLCDLDSTCWSYIFETGRNATKFHNLCSRLLAHPLQRASQKDARYTLSVNK